MQFLILLSLLLLLFVGNAEFGIPKQAEAEVGADGSATTTEQPLEETVQKGQAEIDEELLAKLKEAGGGDLDDQLAIDLAYVIQQVRTDPQSALLLSQMKEGTGQEMFGDFANDLKEMNQKEIVAALAVTLQDLQMLDTLFQDPKQALEVMIEEGLVEETGEITDMYRKDPSLLEDDTRKSVFFTFVSIAAAGGYV